MEIRRYIVNEETILPSDPSFEDCVVLILPTDDRATLLGLKLDMVIESKVKD